MAFSPTVILDNFKTGANQALTARAGWSALPVWSGTPSFSTDAVPTKAVYSGAVGGNAWGTSFVPDQQVEITFAAPVSSAGLDTSLYVRVPTLNTGSPTAGYTLNHGHAGVLYRWSFYPANYTSIIGSTFDQVVATGDSMSLQASGSTISAWYKAAAGSWTFLASVTDTVSPGGGFIGFDSRDASFAIDSFSGGNVVRILTSTGAGI